MTEAIELLEQIHNDLVALRVMAIAIYCVALFHMFERWGKK